MRVVFYLFLNSFVEKLAISLSRATIAMSMKYGLDSRRIQIARASSGEAVGERSRVSGKRNPRSTSHPCFQAPWGRRKGVCPAAPTGLGIHCLCSTVGCARPTGARLPTAVILRRFRGLVLSSESQHG